MSLSHSSLYCFVVDNLDTEEVVTDDDITTLVTELTKTELDDLYTRLGLEIKEIEKAEKDRTADVKKKAKQILTAWRDKNSTEASLGLILWALRHLEYNLHAQNLEVKWRQPQVDEGEL